MEKALVQYADDWRVVVFAYVGALLPWAVLQASDYINERWKTVWRTFAIGSLQAVASLVCLAYMVFYVHVQRVSGDFKEMAAGIYGCLFCLFHVLRILWGLLQLQEWRKWTKRMFITWEALGQNGFRPKQKRKDGEKYAVTVNSSLVDNKFTDAELPYRLGVKGPPFVQWKDLLAPWQWKIGVVPQEPAETIIRWCVTFIGHFGTEWLLQESENALFEQSSAGTTVASTKRDNLAEILGKLLVCNSAGFSRDRFHFSLFGIVHAPYADALPYSPVYQNVPKTTLPFGIETKSIADMNLGRFRQTVRSAVESLDSNLVNKLTSEEAVAVQEISPWHVYSFLQLMQYSVQAKEQIHEPFYFLNLETPASYLSEQLSHQLGYSGELPSSLRDLIDSLKKEAKILPAMFQVQLDNILALRSGKVISSIQETLNHSESTYLWSNCELISDDLTDLRFLQTMRFQGVMMEYVRSHLQRAAFSRPDEDHLTGRCVSNNSSIFDCSTRLKECIGKVEEELRADAEWQMLYSLLILEVQDHLGHKLSCLERSTLKQVAVQESLYLQALCLVSFPSLRIGKSYGDVRNQFEFFIEPVGGAESLCVRVRISKKELVGDISIVNRDGTLTTGTSPFPWLHWKDAFLHRIHAQSDWRQARHVSASSGEWICSHELKNDEKIWYGVDEDIRVWSVWPPFNPGVSQDVKVWNWMNAKLKSAGESKLGFAIGQFWKRFYERPDGSEDTWEDRLKTYKEQGSKRGLSEESLEEDHLLQKNEHVNFSELAQWINIFMNMRAIGSLRFEYIEEFRESALDVLGQPPHTETEERKRNDVMDRARYLIESDLDWASFSSLSSLLMETVYLKMDVPDFLLVAIESMMLREIAADECGDTLGLCLLWNWRSQPNLKPLARLAFRSTSRREEAVTDHERISDAMAKAGRLGELVGAWLLDVEEEDSGDRESHHVVDVVRLTS